MPFIEIEVAYHPESELCRTLAQEIHSHYCRKIGSSVDFSSIGIPVYYITDPNDLNDSQALDADPDVRKYVILLVDETMYGDKKWRSVLRGISNGKEPRVSNPFYLPLIFSERALRLFSSVQVKSIAITQDERELISKSLLAISNNLVRNVFHGSESPGVFISYARKDGQEIAKDIKQYLSSEGSLDSFVDVIDLDLGCYFEEEIDKSIKGSLLLAVLTDVYSGREWCIKELLSAKLCGSPIVIVDAVKEKVNRLSPSIGNAPMLRWGNDESAKDRILEEICYELLRHKYQVNLLEEVKSHLSMDVEADIRIAPFPPEPLIVHQLDSEIYLYPEPPISKHELHLLSKLNEDVSFRSHMELLGKEIFRCKEGGTLIGLSAAIPDDTSKRKFRVSDEHFEEVLSDLVKHLYLAKYKIAYGGIWTKDERFTEIIADIAAMYWDKSEDDVIVNYLSEAYSNKYADDQCIDREEYMEMRRIPIAVSGSKAKSVYGEGYDEDSVVDRAFKALSLSKVRIAMDRDIAARILIGGKSNHDLPSGYPGLLEEFCLAVKSKQPIYLIGGFGGCAHDIAEMLLGKKHVSDFSPNLFSEDFSLEYSKYADDNGVRPLQPDDVDERVFNKGYTLLNNGLSDDENHELVTTRSPIAIASLVLKGLSSSVG